MTANVDGLITEADVRAALAILDGLVEAGLVKDNGERDGRSTYMGVRGYLTAWSADLRTAGYLEGLQEGRRGVGQLLRDLLEGEGL